MVKAIALEFVDSRVRVFFSKGPSVTLENPNLPTELAEYIKTSRRSDEDYVRYLRFTSRNDFGWYKNREEMSVPATIKYSLEKIARDGAKSRRIK